MTSRKLELRNCLLAEQPCGLLTPDLAAAVGREEAIFLQQVHFYCRKNRLKEGLVHACQDGYWWTFHTHEQWAADIGIWSPRTNKRIVKKLCSAGLLVTSDYNRWASDNTLWYRVAYDALSETIGGVQPAASLLIDSPAIPILPSLVHAMDGGKVGLRKAIILQELYWGIAQNQARDDRRHYRISGWMVTWDSVSSLSRKLPWSRRQIGNSLRELLDEGVLVHPEGRNACWSIDTESGRLEDLSGLPLLRICNAASSGGQPVTPDRQPVTAGGQSVTSIHKGLHQVHHQDQEPLDCTEPADSAIASSCGLSGEVTRAGTGNKAPGPGSDSQLYAATRNYDDMTETDGSFTKAVFPLRVVRPLQIEDRGHRLTLDEPWLVDCDEPQKEGTYIIDEILRLQRVIEDWVLDPMNVRPAPQDLTPIWKALRQRWTDRDGNVDWYWAETCLRIAVDRGATWLHDATNGPDTKNPWSKHVTPNLHALRWLWWEQELGCEMEIALEQVDRLPWPGTHKAVKTPNLEYSVNSDLDVQEWSERFDATMHGITRIWRPGYMLEECVRDFSSWLQRNPGARCSCLHPLAEPGCYLTFQYFPRVSGLGARRVPLDDGRQLVEVSRFNRGEGREVLKRFQTVDAYRLYKKRYWERDRKERGLP